MSFRNVTSWVVVGAHTDTINISGSSLVWFWASGGIHGSMSLWRIAQRTIKAVLFAPVFVATLIRWNSTVLAEIPRRAPITLLLSPSQMSFRMSDSLRLSLEFAASSSFFPTRFA